MKKLNLLILLIMQLVNLNAQTFEWAKREGLWAYDYGYGIATDPAGNVYVAGKYELAANFSGTILPDRGNHDIYVAQYNSSGALMWIKTAGGPRGDYAEALYCDGSYLYVAGEIEGWGETATFDGSPPVNITCVGDNDVFLAKYSLTGDLLWVISEGGMQSDKAIGVTADKNGNIYICGYFNGTTNFGGTSITAKGNRDIFIAKYDMNGGFVWVRTAGGSQRDEAKSIKCDGAGNVYVCGLYSDNAVFETQTLASPNGYYNAYLAKYAPDGTLNWIKTAGGDFDEVAWSLTVDGIGKIYVTGEFNASANFDSIQLITLGNADVFVACYDSLGHIQWAKGAGGALIDRARGIGTDGTNIFITGQFGDTATFGSTTLSGVDSSEIFMAELNNAGNFVWATSVGGAVDALETLSYESGNAITADVFGNVYATGALLNGGVFGTTVLTGYGRTDAFITKISQVIISTEEEKSLKKISVYPNPNKGIFDLGISSLGKTNVLKIYNVIGQKVYEAENLNGSDLFQIDLTAQKEGIYFVVITAEGETISNKIIIQ